MTTNLTANASAVAGEITDNQMSQIFWFLFGIIALCCFAYCAWKQYRMKIPEEKTDLPPPGTRARLRFMFKRGPKEAKQAQYGTLPAPGEPVLDNIAPVGAGEIQTARAPAVPPKARQGTLAELGLADLPPAPKPAPAAKPANVAPGEPAQGSAAPASGRGGADGVPSETKPAQKRRGKIKKLAVIKKNKFCPYCDEAYAAYETRRKHIAREHPEQAAAAAKEKAARKAAREAKKK
jgi:hypothetical protein